MARRWWWTGEWRRLPGRPHRPRPPGGHRPRHRLRPERDEHQRGLRVHPPEGVGAEVSARGAERAGSGRRRRPAVGRRSHRSQATGDEILASSPPIWPSGGGSPATPWWSRSCRTWGSACAMAEQGISVLETPVGDRHILEALDDRKLVLGGEQSGHIVFRELATTGDGVLTSLLLLDLVHRSGRSLAELVGGAMSRVPQVLVNVAVADPRLRGGGGRGARGVVDRGGVPCGRRPRAAACQRDRASGQGHGGGYRGADGARSRREPVPCGGACGCR